MSEREFTLEELAEFDGKEGRKAYFAFEGVVYEATGSRLWRNGTHVRVHNAGLDLTGQVDKAPHGPDVMERLERVGTLVEKAAPAPVPEAEEDGIPFYAGFMYKWHAHPASVHYPIALCSAASVLHLVGMLFACSVCTTVAFFNLVLGVASSPIPVLSGFVDWIYQFGGRWTTFFSIKIFGSILFLVLGVVVLLLHFLTGGQPGWLYDLLILSFAPLVLLLGFIGGRITFPT